MKVYVLKYDLNKISTVVPELLHFCTMNMTEGIELYSTEGIFYLDNNTTYKLLYNDKTITKLEKYYEQLDLIIDKSTITREITCQIPPKHLANPIKTFIFKKDTQSKIKLVIIGNKSFNHINNSNIPFMDKNLNKELQVIISDFYMDVPDDIDLNNIFIKEEISEFLFMLNKY